MLQETEKTLIKNVKAMRKSIYHIGMLAAAALAFAGCTKEDNAPEVRTHTITVVAQAEETKTFIVEGTTEASYKWADGDEAYFHITENNVAASSISMSLNADATIATFTATFPDSNASEYTYSAAYYKEKSNNGNLKIFDAQSPALDSFDPTADVLVANDITASTPPASLQFSLRRVVSVNKMTLKQLEEDEVIQSVEITADKALAGYWNPDSYNSNNEFVAEHYNLSGSHKLTLSYGSTAVVPASGEFPVYFICGPQDGIKIGVRVVTDKNVYERNDFTSTVDFKVGVVKRFGVKLGTYGTPVSAGTSYSLIENQADLVDGANYLIVGNNANLAAMGEQKNNNRGAVAVTASNGVITIDNTIEAYPVKIEKVGNVYTIQDIASNDYLYTNDTGNNRLKSKSDVDDYAKWNIEISSGIASITNVGNTSRGVMCYNGSGTNSLFNCYASISSSYNNLSLYIDQAALVPDNRTPVTLSFSPANPAAITLGDTFTEPTLTVDPSTAPVSYSIATTPANIATINASTGVLNITGAGSITVTAAVTDEVTYRPASASYTLTVNAVVVPTGYESTETSNVTLSTTGGTSASDATVDGEDAIKVGTSSAGGAMVINVPSGTTKLHLHAAAWKGVSGLSLDITGATVTPSSIDLTADDGITGNSPFTLAGDPADFYFVLELSNITAETALTFTSSIAKRFVIWGVNAESGPDNREDAGMSWSAASATATWSSTGISFTAPTLTAGHATGITYESTNTAVATINGSGVVTIVGGGETTIKAKFNGDTTYKPATVSYTLTVTDNRTTVETPTFSPAAGTVAANTPVTISCATEGATIHYTVDGSAPTTESPVYSSAITIDATKTVKALAVKENYKNSAVASASYVVGVVNTSTESNPYSVGDARNVADQLGSGSLEDVYVMGIITAITSAYNSTYGNVSFDITADGDNGSDTFRIYRAPASSENDFVVGDAVEFKGILKKYNSTYELDGSAGTLTLIAQVHKPTISPNGGSFTSSQTVSISAESGATIKYSIDGSAPATNYSAELTLTETTTVKAVAIKGILTSGVASATFTKSSGGGNTGGTLTIDFENAASSYSDWTFSNVRTQRTNSNVSAHGGSYFGDTANSSGNGVSSGCYITTTNKIASPSSITFYISKQSTNTAASTWVVKVSSDGSTWTQVGDSQNAGNGVTRGTWYEVTRNLSSYSNVYVRIEYSGSTAIRNIDDVSLSYN